MFTRKRWGARSGHCGRCAAVDALHARLDHVKGEGAQPAGNASQCACGKESRDGQLAACARWIAVGVVGNRSATGEIPAGGFILGECGSELMTPL